MKCKRKDYKIEVIGKPEEIRRLIEELSNSIDKKTSYNMIKENLDNLENIVNPEQFTFGIYHRIYYNKDSLVYVPNTSGKEAKEFHYSIFKEFFEKAYENAKK